MFYTPSSYSQLPETPGVYLFFDERNFPLYVGKAINIKKRVTSYFINKSLLGLKTKIMVEQVKKIKIIAVDSELESLLLEAELIKKITPKYNVKLTDGKSYPLIRITIKDSYPKVLTARRPDDKNSLYFGPYPSTKSLYTVLKLLRRIFPFQSVLNHPKRVCLYNHLGLCPCPPVFASTVLLKTYKKNIHQLIHFLEGKTKKVLRELEKERDILSKKELYDEAKNIQKKIQAIHYITSPVSKPFEYEINPNLKLDKRQEEMESLQTVLQKHGVLVNHLSRIECYDISNISGTNSVGSMVVFIDGEKDTSLYRRFKIREHLSGPNDFIMLQEVLRRRLNHTEWDMPGLFIVDGGKGQVSSALTVLQTYHLSIPLIGLAKREETIITSDLKEISIPQNSPALQLIMRIRDEAHRFAITYHRKLRSKSFLPSK